MTTEDLPVDEIGRLLEALQGLDLTSADGRAGIGTLLAEIERLAPGAVLRQAAGIDLRRLGCVNAPPSTSLMSVRTIIPCLGKVPSSDG